VSGVLILLRISRRAGSHPCTACPIDTASVAAASRICTPCRTGTHTNGQTGTTWCIVTVSIEAPSVRAAGQTQEAREGMCPDCALVVKSERWVSYNGARIALAPPTVADASWALRADFSTCSGGVGNVSRMRGLESAETVTSGENGTLVHEHREFYAYATICCGVNGRWGPALQLLPYCKSVAAAAQILEHFEVSCAFLCLCLCLRVCLFLCLHPTVAVLQICGCGCAES